MIRRSKGWFIATLLFCVVNAAGVAMAAMMREVVHTATHVALLVAGVYGLRYIWYMGMPPERDVMRPAELDGKLTHLEVSLQDAAMRVDQMGKGQREINEFFAGAATPAVRRAETHARVAKSGDE
ncbi:MAG: hypothetical protein M3Z30_01265 [Gemmatimonadota bacterium]|nr:hypothetical protein [Gemmatimonadota bacterium]